MISIPGSLSFVMSSAPAKNLRGMPDVRPKIHTPTATLSHKISTQIRIRSAFVLRRTHTFFIDCAFFVIFLSYWFSLDSTTACWNNCTLKGQS